MKAFYRGVISNELLGADFIILTLPGFVRKGESKCRALTEFTVNRHPTAVRFNELLDDGKAESHAAFLVWIGF